MFGGGQRHQFGGALMVEHGCNGASSTQVAARETDQTAGKGTKTKTTIEVWSPHCHCPSHTHNAQVATKAANGRSSAGTGAYTHPSQAAMGRTATARPPAARAAQRPRRAAVLAAGQGRHALRVAPVADDLLWAPAGWRQRHHRGHVARGGLVGTAASRRCWRCAQPTASRV